MFGNCRPLFLGSCYDNLMTPLYRYCSREHSHALSSVQGKWIKYANWNKIVDPLNGEYKFIAIIYICPAEPVHLAIGRDG